MTPKRPISIGMFLFLILNFIHASNAFGQAYLIDRATTRLIMAGAESNEFTDLIEQIKKDLKIENLSVKVIIVPHDERELTGELVKILGGYIILVNGNISKNLTLDERKALISHEMGHIMYSPKVHVYDLARTGLDICADFFAVKYAGVDATLSLLEKLYTMAQDERDQPDYKIRKAVLEEVRRN